MIVGPAAVAGALVVALVDRFEVVGDSMRPTLCPGERLLTLRTRRPRQGDIAVLRDPRRPDRLVVKRVVARSPDGVTVAGDNPAASTDSRQFGAVPTGDVRARVVYRYWPPDRRGRVPAEVP